MTSTLRDDFVLDPHTVFLNHGSYGACPREVLAAQQAWQLEMERNPVQFLGRRSSVLLGEARAVLASALGAQADDLAFVTNATTGVHAVARSLDLQPGDEVLATDHEYGACDAGWQQVCAERGAHYRRVEIPLPFDSAGFASRLLAAATARTRLVFASHVTSTTALVLPVADLCRQARERGWLTLIDGAHAPGQLPLALDALGADYYTGNCHKWLCAPKGAAFLHVRAEHHGRLHAPIAGWGAVAEAAGASGLDSFTGTSVLQRRMQWLGTRDIAAWLAVPAAVEFQRRHDWPAVRARCHAMAVPLMHRVAARFGLPAIAADDDFAQMVPCPVPAAAGPSLQQRLFERHHIEVPVTQHGGHRFVRVSVQGYNTEADLAALEAALNAEIGSDDP